MRQILRKYPALFYAMSYQKALPHTHTHIFEIFPSAALSVAIAHKIANAARQREQQQQLQQNLCILIKNARAHAGLEAEQLHLLIN